MTHDAQPAPMHDAQDIRDVRSTHATHDARDAHSPHDPHGVCDVHGTRDAHDMHGGHDSHDTHGTRDVHGMHDIHGTRDPHDTHDTHDVHSRHVEHDTRDVHSPHDAHNPRDTRDTLLRLAAIIDSRKGGDPDASYVARLFHKGDDAVLKKIGEEATEVVLAAKDARHGGAGAPASLVGEMADLWFHCLVALSHFGLNPADVLAELERREGLSGLEEKALRKQRARERSGD